MKQNLPSQRDYSAVKRKVKEKMPGPRDISFVKHKIADGFKGLQSKITTRDLQ